MKVQQLPGNRPHTLHQAGRGLSSPGMADSPRRLISVRVKGDLWRHQTVQGHIAHPPRQQYQSGHVAHPQRQQYQSQTVHGHISTPVTIQSQRKRHRNPSPDSSHHATAQSGRCQRRRVKAEPLTPARSLINDYIKRKAATARFPPKITPQHIRAAMCRYE
jgi:hypothetical protein